MIKWFKIPDDDDGGTEGGRRMESLTTSGSTARAALCELLLQITAFVFHTLYR